MAGSYFTLSSLNALGLGALFAYWSVYRKDYIDFFLKPYWMIGVAIVYFGFNYWAYINNVFWYKEIINEPFFAVLSVLVINYASRNKFTGAIKWFLESKFVIYAGKISYGMYVYHLFMPPLFWFLAGKIGFRINNAWVAFIVYFLLTYLVSHLSWKLFEKPINNLKKRYPYIEKTI
jgi:peptidoglycan/LPS O-acetylase OafA/YrhL